MDDNIHPERRYDDDHTRQIVKLTVHEMLDGVGVDFTTPEGRQRFRDNITFLDDARSGTGAAKKGLWGIMLTGFAFGMWKVFVFLFPVITK